MGEPEGTKFQARSPTIRPMNYYEIWFDLAPGAKDLETCDAVCAWLDAMKDKGMLESYQITRRKFGFGPADLGEFHVSIAYSSLAQLDEGFEYAATRSAEAETLHKEVYTRITNYKSGLYRTFPDAFRIR